MGVLSGVRIIEMVGQGPGPFCGMLLADLGADVIAVERPAADIGKPRPSEICSRGKRSIVLDVKEPESLETLFKLIDTAAALIEGMRPGVMERLGLGPDVCLERRPSLVYGRVTGWGQDGPLAQAAGHDANYVALSGALWLSTQAGQRPEAPPGLLGDVAGGGLYLAIGVLAGILRARQDGCGQIVDASMLEGAAHMLNFPLAYLPGYYGGSLAKARPAGLGTHWDRAYACADGEWIVIQPVEPQFYAELLKRLGLDQEERFANHQNEPNAWASLADELAALFTTKSRVEWSRILEGTNACFAPLLAPDEAAAHPHNVARGVYRTIDGVLQAAPSPKFSATPSDALGSVPPRGQHTQDILAELGVK